MNLSPLSTLKIWSSNALSHSTYDAICIKNRTIKDTWKIEGFSSLILLFNNLTPAFKASNSKSKLLKSLNGQLIFSFISICYYITLWIFKLPSFNDKILQLLRAVLGPPDSTNKSSLSEFIPEMVTFAPVRIDKFHPPI
jgi:hypothetical protein